MELQTEKISLQQEADSPPSTLLRFTLPACLLSLTVGLSLNVWSPLLIPLSHTLHLALPVGGLFYVLMFAGYISGTLVGGIALDHYSPRWTLIGAVFLLCINMLAMYLGVWRAGTLPVGILLLATVLGGVGVGIIDAANSGLMSLVYAHRRGMILSLLSLLLAIGGGVIALLSALFLALFHDSPAPSFFFIMCFSCIVILSLFAIFPKTAGLTRQMQKIDQEQAAFLPLMLTLAPLIIVLFLLSVAVVGVSAWLPSYLQIRFGLTSASAALYSSAIWVSLILGRLGAASLLVRIGSWKMLMLSVFIILLGLILMLLSPAAGLADISFTITYLGFSPILATFLALVGERAKQSLGAMTGIILFIYGMAELLGIWLFGIMLAAWGPFSSTLLCLICILPCGIIVLQFRRA